jgi:UDP-3-O-[3-hydroxymyristoyl] glucosamine N-acyltransferase LpxD
MPFRLTSFASIPGLTIVRDGEFSTTGKLSTALKGMCVPLRDAAFVDAVNANQRIAAIITTAEIAALADKRFALGIAASPDAVHAEIHALCAQTKAAELRQRPNKIDRAALIDSNARIGAYGVEIGARAFIGANAVISPGVTIDNDAVIHSGVSVGGPGFNTALVGGKRRIVPQVGGVHIGQFVEVLANCCIARAIFGGNTRLGEETLVDNLVYIAHDVQVGRRVQICALTNVLGRVVIGDEAYIGPSSVIRNGLKIGAFARVSMGAVVTKDVAANETVTGNFAVPHELFLQNMKSTS